MRPMVAWLRHGLPAGAAGKPTFHRPPSDCSPYPAPVVAVPELPVRRLDAELGVDHVDGVDDGGAGGTLDPEADQLQEARVYHRALVDPVRAAVADVVGRACLRVAVLGEPEIIRAGGQGAVGGHRPGRYRRLPCVGRPQVSCRGRARPHTPSVTPGLAADTPAATPPPSRAGAA